VDSVIRLGDLASFLQRVRVSSGQLSACMRRRAVETCPAGFFRALEEPLQEADDPGCHHRYLTYQPEAVSLAK